MSGTARVREAGPRGPRPLEQIAEECFGESMEAAEPGTWWRWMLVSLDAEARAADACTRQVAARFARLLRREGVLGIVDGTGGVERELEALFDELESAGWWL